MKKIRFLLALIFASVGFSLECWSVNEDSTEYDELLSIIPMHSLHSGTIKITSAYKTIEKGTKWFRVESPVGETSELRATISCPTEGFLYYEGPQYISDSIEVYIDGTLVRNIKEQHLYVHHGFYEYIDVGTHEVVWKAKSDKITIDKLGVISTPCIIVDLLEPGSLGTEVLYNVDHVNKVRNLKVRGKMNSEDLRIIKVMSNLVSLDLSEAELEEIPGGIFSTLSGEGTSTTATHSYLARVILPQTLKKIGDGAFGRTFAEGFELTSSLTSIGKYAFEYSRIAHANLIGVSNIPKGAFHCCYSLEDIQISDNLTSIEESAFSGCSYTKEQTIRFPQTLNSIGADAFYKCHQLSFRFPDKSLEFGKSAFYETGIDSLIIYKYSETLSDYYNNPFSVLRKLVYAEYSTDCYILNMDVFNYSKVDKTIVLKSPTVVSKFSNSVNVSYIKGAKLIVPSYLVNSYKLDDWWSNVKIVEGFSTTEIQDWIIQRSLILNPRERIEGNPNIVVNKTDTYLKINGDAPMTINNFEIVNSFSYDKKYSQLFSNCSNISINGYYRNRINVGEKNWYFISLPFDMKVGDITPANGDMRFVVRYYDGANRSVNGMGGNWKNYSQEDIIPAGTGFIFQADKKGDVYFYSTDNDSKQNSLSNSPFVKSLETNASDNAANRGWNLVGNPWQCYYNIHKLSFTAPITVWNGSTYVAYSVIDDDYAIRPNEAFFVQCPEEVNSIGFPTDGRQLTSTIESQNATRPMSQQTVMRRLFDLEISNGTVSDHTRFVWNEAASLDYEANKDAGKFFSMDESTPQIYTIGVDGAEYAINERPLGNGIIALGVVVPTTGNYSFTALRNDFDAKVFLIDTLTGEQTDLSDMDYSLTLDGGTYIDRFVLDFRAATVTGVNSMMPEKYNTDSKIYDLQGRRTNIGKHGVYILNGKKIVK